MEKNMSIVDQASLLFSRRDTSTLARLCVSNGRESHLKGLLVRRARPRFMSSQTAYLVLQRRLQKRSEDLRLSTNRTKDGGHKPHCMAGKDKGGHKIR
ncbi:hypothetical protein ElyMa_006864800 [Elysia marginata]|uniref:Uncharacterized protein n=1 Tax=Elysia marginata TaxID=1093978 RepID=A0AAV4JBN8_9GAST|nr:hypothetical protein ElyMa_006864800 [Elysia marginata]